MHESADHLGGDPLAGVLGGGVEHGRALPVLGLLGVLGDLEGQDLLSVDAVADRHQLGDLGVRSGRGTQLIGDPALGAVGPEHVETLGQLLAGSNGGLLPVDPLDGGLDALGAELGGLPVGDDHLEADVAAGGLVRNDVVGVDAHLVEHVEPAGGCLDDVHLEGVIARGPGGRWSRRGRRRGQEHAEDECGTRNRDGEPSHDGLRDRTIPSACSDLTRPSRKTCRTATEGRSTPARVVRPPEAHASLVCVTGGRRNGPNRPCRPAPRPSCR